MNNNNSVYVDIWDGVNVPDGAHRAIQEVVRECARLIYLESESSGADAFVVFRKAYGASWTEDVKPTDTPILFVEQQDNNGWRMIENSTTSSRGFSVFSDLRSLQDGVAEWIRHLPEPPARGLPGSLVGMTIEEFCTAYDLLASRIERNLSADEQREARSFRSTAGELAKVQSPDSEVVRGIFRWFGRKLDLLVDEAARTAGKGIGFGAGVAVGIGLWS